MDFPKSSKEGATRGTTNALPCPWCGSTNKGLDQLELKRHVVLECDYCHNLFELTSIFEVTHLVAERHGDLLHSF